MIQNNLNSFKSIYLFIFPQIQKNQLQTLNFLQEILLIDMFIFQQLYKILLEIKYLENIYQNKKNIDKNFHQ